MPNTGDVGARIVFLGLDLLYTNQVLTPRLETESLVLGVARRVSGADTIIDVGTGSGAIILSLRSRYPEARLHAVDISPTALAVAQKNADIHHISVDFQLGDLLSGYLTFIDHESLSEKEVLIVANLPYIGLHETIGDDVRTDDPHLALFGGGADGFMLIRDLLNQGLELSKCCRHLHIALEFGHLQLPLVQDWCNEHGLTMESWTDYSNIPRFALIDYGHH